MGIWGRDPVSYKHLDVYKRQHNEREKDSYSNQDIVPERTPLNVHFKDPTDDYVKMFDQMEQDGVISTRGLKPDAIKYGELVFDVNLSLIHIFVGGNQAIADKLLQSWNVLGVKQPIQKVQPDHRCRSIGYRQRRIR